MLLLENKIEILEYYKKWIINEGFHAENSDLNIRYVVNYFKLYVGWNIK